MATQTRSMSTPDAGRWIDWSRAARLRWLLVLTVVVVFATLAVLASHVNSVSGVPSTLPFPQPGPVGP